MKRKISSAQLLFSVASFIVASRMITKVLYSYLKQDSWIGILLGYLISLPVLMIYGALAKRFPSKNIIEISEAVFGKILGKIISACYTFYFMSLAVLYTRSVGTFVKTIILPNTPMALILILFVFICSWAVKKGIIGLTGCSTVLAAISAVLIIFNFLLLFKELEFKNFLPAFAMQPKNYLIGAHVVAAQSLCEIFVFFMLVPHMQKPEEFGRTARAGVTVATVILLIVTARDIAVLGSYTVVSTMPSFSVLRLIDVGDIFTRLESLYTAIHISLLFFNVSILYYATVSGFSRLLNVKSHQCFIHIFGALMITGALSVFESSYEHTQWNSSAAAIYATLFLFFLPAATLIAAAIRRLPGKETEHPA